MQMILMQGQGCVSLRLKWALNELMGQLKFKWPTSTEEKWYSEIFLKRETSCELLDFKDGRYEDVI